MVYRWKQQTGYFEKLAHSIQGLQTINGRSGIWTHTTIPVIFPLVLFPLCYLSKGKNTADNRQIIGKFLHCATTWCDVSESHSVVSDSLQPHGLYNPWKSPSRNTGVGRLSLLQGIFQTHRLNPGLPHCRRILYQLSHKESPRILEWVAYPFSSRSSQSRNWTGVFCIAGGFFTSWVTRKAHDVMYSGTTKKFFFLPDCCSLQVVYQAMLFLSTPEMKRRGWVWKGSSPQEWWAR